MKTHRKYTPYVRRANGKEKSDSLRNAYRLAFYQSLGKPFFVMVQRGFPNNAIGVYASKREAQRSPVMVRHKRQTFRTWATSVRRIAQGMTR